MEYKATLCPGCGQPRHESFDRANHHAYKAESMRCFSCAERGREALRWSTDSPIDRAGLFFTIEQRDDD